MATNAKFAPLTAVRWDKPTLRISSINAERCNEISPSTSPGTRDPASVGLTKLLKLSLIDVVAVKIFLEFPITSMSADDIKSAATLRSLLLTTRTWVRIV